MVVRDQTWLRLLCSRELHVENTEALSKLFAQLPHPHIQRPSLLFFIGKKVKNEAIRHMFPYNNTGRSECKGIARIRSDKATTEHPHPTFFADAELNFDVSTRSVSTDKIDQIYCRVLFAISQMVILFVDDFPSVDAMLERMLKWISIGTRCDTPTQVKPRLLLVVKQRAGVREKMRALYSQVEFSARGQLKDVLSLVSTVYLEQGEVSPAARFRRLKETVLQQSDEHRVVLANHRWQLSANHFQGLFTHRFRHATLHGDPCCIMEITRPYHESATDFTYHISRVFEFGLQHSIPYEVSASLVGSSLLADAYPENSHCEDQMTNSMQPRR